MKYFVVLILIGIVTKINATNISTSRLTHLQKYYDRYARDQKVALEILDEADRSSTRLYELIKLLDFLNENDGLYSIVGLILGGMILDVSGNHPDVIILNDIRDRLPDVIKKFPWNGEIRLRNHKTDRCLCESINKFGTTSYRKLIMANRYYDRENCAWIVEMDISERSVKLRNKDSNQYLFAGGDGLTFSADQRNVLTIGVFDSDAYDKKKEAAKWQFEPLATGAYRVSNLFFDEYLYNLKDTISDTLFTKSLCLGNGCIWTVDIIDNYELNAFD